MPRRNLGYISRDKAENYPQPCRVQVRVRVLRGTSSSEETLLDTADGVLVIWLLFRPRLVKHSQMALATFGVLEVLDIFVIAEARSTVPRLTCIHRQ